MSGNFAPSDLKKLSVTVLKKKCKSLRISSQGGKRELIKRLLENSCSRDSIILIHRSEKQLLKKEEKKRQLQKTATTTKRKNIKRREKKKQPSQTSSKSSQTPSFIIPYKFPAKFSKSLKKINNPSFYKNNPAVIEEFVSIPPDLTWKQSVRQYSNRYEEGLTITFQGSAKRINSKELFSSQQPTNKQLLAEFSKSKKIYNRCMRKLLKPYLQINSIIDMILTYNGPHLLPIRYSVDLLPYFYSTIRSPKSRENIWSKAVKDDYSSKCVLDFTPATDIIVVEDIYDEWVTYIRTTFSLRSQFQETAIFYIPYNKGFMAVPAGNYLSNAVQAKQIFTKLYINALCSFANCEEYAFRLDLYGINYYYELQKRRSPSPIDWGSRSRCWDGEGMVLLSDGTEKPIKHLSVGDEVAVLDTLPNGVSTGCKTGKVTVKIESVVNRTYDMVSVGGKLWITPYHAVLNRTLSEWQFPCQLAEIEERFEESIFNFILDGGAVLCVNGVWGCTLGHDLRGDVIENPMWGSSQVMHDMWSKVNGYPNIVEYI